MLEWIMRWIAVNVYHRRDFMDVSTGDADANRPVRAGATGKLDNTLLKTGSGNGLDADLLDGNHATAFAGSAHNHDSTYVNESDYTANDVLTKIKTVDGAASGLDADLLDGNHASAFATFNDAEGDPALIQGVTADGTSVYAARRDHSHSVIGLGITSGLIGLNAVGNTNLADMAQATVKGRADGAGTGDPTDLTAAQVIGIIATADGAGSGLDADTLDGIDSASYARTDIAETFDNNVTITGLLNSQKQAAKAGVSLNDDVTSTLVTAGRGLIYVVRASSNQHFLGFFSSGGIVEIADNAGTWVNSDTDGNNCLYWSSGLVLKNRTGSPQTYYYHIWGDVSIT